MKITGTYDLSKHFDSMKEVIKNLANNRDRTYSEISSFKANSDLTPEAQLRKIDAAHKEYAAKKRAALCKLIPMIDDICDWDNNQAKLDVSGKFKDTIQLASALSGDISPSLVKAMSAACTNRLELECLCGILRGKIGAASSPASQSALHDLESRIYDPVLLYDSVKNSIYECLSNSDYMLDKLAAAISGMLAKIKANSDDTGYVTFSVDDFKNDCQVQIYQGFGLSGASDTASPVQMIYINGKLVDSTP